MPSFFIKLCIFAVSFKIEISMPKNTILLTLMATMLTVGAAFAQRTDDIQIESATVEMQDGSQPLATAIPRFSWRYNADTLLRNVQQTS